MCAKGHTIPPRNRVVWEEMKKEGVMKVTCFGSRGSIPTPARKDFDTREFGGNTNCYYIEAGPFRVIIDNGSGCAVLGDQLMKELVIPGFSKGQMGLPFINLISHYHWDHIQGLPFCVPFFIPGNTFHIHGPTPSGHETTHQPRSAVEMMLTHQQSNPHFPVAHECLPAKKTYTGHDRQFSETLSYYTADDGRTYQEFVGQGGSSHPMLKITTIPLHHPDGCIGYRLDFEGKSVAYCSDNEPFRHPNAHINKLAEDADLLIMDGQYTEDQLKGMNQGFGHGTIESCIEQFRACGAKKLVIHHHNPGHDDETLKRMEGDVIAHAEFAREGTVWEL